MKNKMLFRFALTAMAIVVTSLSGCATLSTALQTHSQKIEAACTSVGTAIQILAIARENGKLSDAVSKSVDSLIAVTEPVCTAPTAPTLASAEQQTFNAAVAQLAALGAQYGSTK